MSDTERELGLALRHEEHQLDARLAARIAGARRKALDAPRQAWYASLLAPAIGAAVLAGVLGVAFLPGIMGPDLDSSGQTADAVELDQDVDFYLWLADQDEGSHG